MNHSVVRSGISLPQLGAELTWKGMWRAGRLLNHCFCSRARITKGIVSMPGVMMAFLLATTCNAKGTKFYSWSFSVIVTLLGPEQIITISECHNSR